MKFDELYLWYLAEPTKPRLVGQLRLVDGGRAVSLQYDQTWMRLGFPLSEDLPLVDIEQLPRWRDLAVGAVDDARPDRWGERVIKYLDRPDRNSIMEFLYYAGDERFGALGVSRSPSTYEPRPTGPLPRLQDAQELSEIVRKVSLREPVTAIERRIVAASGSLGGAKPKALVEIGGVQWVIKFFNNEYVDLPLVEHASMTLAKLAGINVAETQVVPLQGENAVAVRRYDRHGVVRVHCISAGTALRAGTPGGQDPVFGYPQLALLLRRVGVEDDDANLHDMRELFRRMVFNILIDNTDDHEKNHALMAVAPAGHGRYRLTPAYDVLPTDSGQGLHQFVIGIDAADGTLSNAMSQSELFGYDTKGEAAMAVAQVIQVVNGWREHFATCGVSARDIDSLASQIDGQELLSQRETFDAESFVTPARRVRRRSPFAG